MFPENKTGKCFFPFSTIKKFHVQKQYLWRDCMTFHEKQNLFIFFFSRRHFQKVLYHSVILFSFFLIANIICICYYFHLLSWPFLRARESQFIYSTLSSFSGWCRAQECRSGLNDICTLQHGFLYFLLFLYLYFLFSSFYYHTCMCFIPSARSLRFGSRL